MRNKETWRKAMGSREYTQKLPVQWKPFRDLKWRLAYFFRSVRFSSDNVKTRRILFQFGHILKRRLFLFSCIHSEVKTSQLETEPVPKIWGRRNQPQNHITAVKPFGSISMTSKNDIIARNCSLHQKIFILRPIPAL